MRKDRKLWGWLLLPVVVLCVMFAVEGICNWELLRLPAEQKGVFDLDISQAVVACEPTEAYPDPGFAPETVADLGAIDLSDAAFTVTLPYTGYVERLELDCSCLADTDYVVDCTLPDGTVKTYLSTTNLLFSGDTIRIGASVTRLRIRSLLGGLQCTGLRVDTLPSLDPFRMLFSGLCTAALGLLLLLRGRIAEKPELGFLIVALAAGLIMCLCQPNVTSLDFDDQIHFERAWKISTGYDDAFHNGAETLATALRLSASIDTRDDMARVDALLDQAAQTGLDDSPSSLPHAWELTDIGYVTQAAGLWSARVLGLPFHTQVSLGRLLNLLGYVAVCYFAIRSVKHFRLLLAAVALLPSPLFLASSYSYDPTCAGLCFLAIALGVDAILDRDTKLTWSRALVILVSLVVAGLVKAVYLPLLLLLLLLPRSKFDSKGQRMAFKGLSMVLLAAGLMSILLNISTNLAVLQDARGDGADSAAQVQFILAHPLTYLTYFFTYLWDHFSVFLLNDYRVPFGYLGGLSGAWNALSLGLLFFAVFTANDSACKSTLNWKQRSALFIIAGLCTGLIFTTMYVGFTAVGSTTFAGVQGRYMLPIIPLVFMLLSPSGVQDHMERRSWHTVFFVGNGVILATQSWLILLCRFCL